MPQNLRDLVTSGSLFQIVTQIIRTFFAKPSLLHDVQLGAETRFQSKGAYLDMSLHSFAKTMKVLQAVPSWSCAHSKHEFCYSPMKVRVTKVRAL
jgi:hypothetical protein